MTLRHSLLVMALVTTLLGTGCGSAQDQGVSIANARSPLAPPGVATVAVYADISARHADTLVGISTPVAASAQVHSMTEEGGMMKMRPLPQLELRQGETVHLEPGGLHLMLMGVREPLPEGAQIPLVFHFANAGDVAATAQVTVDR